MPDHAEMIEWKLSWEGSSDGRVYTFRRRSVQSHLLPSQAAMVARDFAQMCVVNDDAVQVDGMSILARCPARGASYLFRFEATWVPAALA